MSRFSTEQLATIDAYYARERAAERALRSIPFGRIPQNMAYQFAGNLCAEQLVGYRNRHRITALLEQLDVERRQLAARGETMSDEEFGRRCDLAVSMLMDGSLDGA